jgi:YHS domain-containing protein
MKISIISVLLLLTVSFSHAQINKNSDGLALEGYDVVSYFTGKPVEGNKKYSVNFKSTNYYFNSEANKKLFISNPSKYLPQYGGYCAYAMGLDGSLVEIDPETYKIIEGKLYLFYNAYFNNTKTKWDKDEKNLKAKADKNWKLLVSH